MNHNQITALKPKSKTYKKGLGNGFFVEVHKVYKNKNGEGNLKNGSKKHVIVPVHTSLLVNL